MNWIDQAIDDYYKWLKNRTTYTFDQQTRWCEVNTPFAGMFNDLIDIYVKKEGTGFLLSDDGDTFDKLSLAGLKLVSGSKRQQWVQGILSSHGISLNGTELQTRATIDNLAMKQHSLISAIIELSDLEYVAQPNVESLFVDDVRQLLDQMETIYTPNFITKGSTGIDFTFDFQLAGKNKETVIKLFNSLNRNNVPNFLFSWGDIKEVRERASRKALSGLAIINDTDKAPREEFLNALTIKGADYILWSQRHSADNRNKLRPTA
jgi:hypothetical protein